MQYRRKRIIKPTLKSRRERSKNKTKSADRKRRPLIARILIVFGILLLIATIGSLSIYNFNFGIVIFCIISFILILYGFYYEKLIRKKWLTIIIIAMIAFFVIMMISIGAYGKSDNVTYEEDAVIVFGAGIRGENVSPALARRLDKAIEYTSANTGAVIVVSGGQGPQEDITEALAMERYLIDKGVPPEKIIKEEEATSTYENLLYSKEILDNYLAHPYSVVIITCEFHIYRGTRLAEKLDLDVTHFHSKTTWYSVPMNYSRECVAVLKFWATGK